MQKQMVHTKMGKFIIRVPDGHYLFLLKEETSDATKFSIRKNGELGEEVILRIHGEYAIVPEGVGTIAVEG